MTDSTPDKLVLSSLRETLKCQTAHVKLISNVTRYNITSLKYELRDFAPAFCLKSYGPDLIWPCYIEFINLILGQARLSPR